MNDWYETLPGLRGHVWSELQRGAASADAPARLVVLATVDAGGGPRARTVALREVDPEAGILKIHTDAQSHKVAELQGNSKVALHVWLPNDTLQIRLRGTARIKIGPEVDDDWSRVPEVSRGNYGVVPAPGTPIPQAEAYDRQPQRQKFAVLEIAVNQIDAVYLGDPIHRRAEFSRASDWVGQWRAP